MGRPRQKDADLPKRLFYRHGRYYYVRRGRWRALSTERDVAIKQAEELNAGLPAHGAYGKKKEILSTFRRMFTTTRNNARGRGIPFHLTFEDVSSLLEKSNWQCAVTGTRFSLEPINGAKRRPFAPSIDRIDSRGCYELGNVRVVCVAANIAMGDWGDIVLRDMLRNYAKKLGLQPEVLDNTPLELTPSQEFTE